MRNVLPAFEFRDDNVMPLGFKKINCHMLFDLKLDLVCNARFVAGQHQMDPPKESVYSSIISCNSVHLAFPYCSAELICGRHKHPETYF
jgi:hypothetical protein